jgi:hypothetical protein
MLTELGGEAARRAVFERARVQGEFSAREYGASLPEAAARKYANPVEHALSWALTNLKRDGLVENPRRGTWRLTGVAAASEEAAAEEMVSLLRLAELRAMPYADYLRTPEWQRTRAAALMRAQHRCVLDARHTARLEVHHSSYDRLGAELASDLAVLCHSCHWLHHNTNDRAVRIPAGTTAPVESAGAGRDRSIAPPGWVEARHLERGREPVPVPSGTHRLAWLRRVLAR